MKPLDVACILKMADTHDGIITLEEGSRQGGAGSAVVETLMQHQKLKPTLILGLPDSFIKHGATDAIRHELQLDAQGIMQQIQTYFKLS